MLVLVRGFSYTPDAIFSEKFLIQSSCCFSLVRFFPLHTSCYIPDASFNESTLFLPALVWGFFDTPDTSQILMSFGYTLRVQWF